ncbi:MAG: DUF6519 domain-containing protein [Planctomycetota bacterium]
MAGDTTRRRFRPRLNLGDPREQQGRVRLDADANEAADYRTRLSRTTTYDTLWTSDRDDVCVVPRGTKDAFLLQVVEKDGVERLELGLGRAYVHGIQIENHGLEVSEWSSVLAEEVARVALPYERQPYFPADPPDPGDGDRKDLYYLDVFEYELEPQIHPELLEEALDGADTTTRVRTVWQVRTVQGIAGDCSTEIPGRLLTTGRLTTSTLATPVSEDPCIIAAGGGYRGIANRQYRVEVHNAGGLGQATFKWSRTNSSVVTRVEEIDGTNVTVQSIGRDQVLDFEAGDWVEVNSVTADLRGEPGQMRRVKAVRAGTRVLELEEVLAPEFDLDEVVFLRRWDHATEDDGGVLPVVAGPIELEDGIRVEFSAGRYESKAAWCFAARTATGQVDELTDAPPVERHHHYAKLGYVTWRAFGASQVSDCRQLWPEVGGEGCCTIVVSPGQSIQDALESLPEAGGCVCLKTGRHELAEPVRLQRSDVCLVGESPATVVVRTNGLAALVIGGQLELRRVAVHDIRFVGQAEHGATVIRADRVQDLSIRECRFEYTGEVQGTFMAVSTHRCSDLIVERNEVSGFPGGLLLNEQEGSLQVLDNRIKAPKAAPEGVGIALQSFAVDASAILKIAWNHVEGFQTGVQASENRNRVEGMIHVHDNLVTDSGTALHLEGIRHARISRNAIREAAVGVQANEGYELDLTENEVVRTTIAAKFSAVHAVLQANVVQDCGFPGGTIACFDGKAQVVQFQSNKVFFSKKEGSQGTALALRASADESVAIVEGNILEGMALSTVVRIGIEARYGRITFTSNDVYCQLEKPSEDGLYPVTLSAEHMVVSNNQLHGSKFENPRFGRYGFNLNKSHVLYLGNYATLSPDGATHVLPMPISSFNRP